MVVLHKMQVQPGRLVEGALVETLEEKAAVVAKDLRLQQQYIGDGAGRDLHRCAWSRSSRNRYCP